MLERYGENLDDTKLSVEHWQVLGTFEFWNRFSYSKRILQILKCSLFTFPQALNKKLKIRNIWKHGNKKNMEKGVDMISTIL